MKLMLKAGIAMLGALAIVATVAGVASAHYVLTPGEVPPDTAVITGEQIEHEVEGVENNYFQIGTKSKFTCENEKTKYVGTSEKTEVTDLTVHPTYAGCKVSNVEVKVDTKGCDYTLTAETNATGHGIVHLICEEGKDIQITIPSANCTVTIHPQTPTSGGVVYTNTEGTPDDIHATATVEGITYEVKNPGPTTLCTAAAGANGTEANNAKLITKITLRAYEDNGLPEGNQVKLTVD